MAAIRRWVVRVGGRLTRKREQFRWSGMLADRLRGRLGSPWYSGLNPKATLHGALGSSARAEISAMLKGILRALSLTSMGLGYVLSGWPSCTAAGFSASESAAMPWMLFMGQ